MLLVSLIVAPGARPPVESFMVPWMAVERDCGQLDTAATRSKSDGVAINEKDFKAMRTLRSLNEFRDDCAPGNRTFAELSESAIAMKFRMQMLTFDERVSGVRKLPSR
jgi:hypothetical protein